MVVEFHPSAEDTGLVFVRGDMSPATEIPARVEYRQEIPRRTALFRNGARVEMVEHILAALHGLRIDNCRIVVNAAEMPALDGSCRELVHVLRSAGIAEQTAGRATIVVPHPVRVEGEGCWIMAEPSSEPVLSLHYELDYGAATAIGRQRRSLGVTPESFASELASARTFLLEEEAAQLRAAGLGQRVSHADLLVFGPEGVMGNTLRFTDECVRHKMLDLVGDLALAGCDIQGRITAYRAGHRLHARLVTELLAQHSASTTWKQTA